MSKLTRRGFIQALGLAIAGAIIPLPKYEPKLFIDDGTGYAGQVLMSDGAGNASWVTPDLIPDSTANYPIGSQAGQWNKCYVLELESLESVWPTSR